MRFLPPKVLRIADDLIDQMFRNHNERIKQLVAVPITTGVLLEDMDIAAAGTDVIHGLERTPVGAIVVKSDTAAAFKLDDFTRTTITVTPSTGTPIVSLWVF